MESGDMTNPTIVMNSPANTPVIPQSGAMMQPTMNPPANMPIIPHVESSGMTNPTIGNVDPVFKVECDVMMNPPKNTPIIPHMENGAVAIPKVDKDDGDYSVLIIEIKPTKKRRYGLGTCGDTVTKSCTCCPDNEYESDYYDK